MKKILFAGAVLFAAASLFSTETELIRNGGFESIGQNSFATDWNQPSGDIWSVSEEKAFEGKRSLLYHNRKQGEYRFTFQHVPAEPDGIYDYSCMVKLIPLKPDITAKALIFLEYYNGSAYVTGKYQCNVKTLNTDWVILSGRARIPAKGVDSVRLGLSVNPAGTADVKIWFDKVSLKKAEFALFNGALTTNCYRDQAFQGKVKVFCGIEEHLRPASVTKEIRLSVCRNGKIILSAKPDQVLSDRLIYSFDSGKLAPGKYQLVCAFRDPVTKKDFSISHPFTKLQEMPVRKSYVDEYNRMILDGKPFFPLGMYFRTVTEKDIALFKSTKMNTLMPYSPPDRKILDLLHKNHLKIFYSTKDCVSAQKYDDGFSTKKKHAEGIAAIDAVKDHPAIAAWYINDELPKDFLQDALQFRQAVEEADPSRPVWSVLCRPDDFRLFTTASDIHGSDPYPVPKSRLKMALAWTQCQNKAVMGTKMLIQVPQVFCWGRYWVKHGRSAQECAQCRRPSMKEVEAMSWMCIAGGANGLMYYSYFDLWLRDAPTDILPRIPFETTFGEIRTVTSRIMKYEKVLLSAGKNIPYKVLKDGNGDIGHRAYGLEGSTWILAVNSNEKQEQEFLLETGYPVILLETGISDAAVMVKGKNLSVSLKPLQTIFIRVCKKQ